MRCTLNNECFPGSHAAILRLVADFTPVVKSDVKIKRKGDITLQLKPTQDIAAALGAVKRPDQYLVGFALETTDEFSNAAEKMERKNLDFIVLNSLRDEGAGFGYDTNKVTIIDRESSQELPLQSKKNVAKAIVGRLAKLMLTLLLFIAPAAISSQELDPQVSVNTSKIQGTDKDVFTTMQMPCRIPRNQVWTSYHFATTNAYSVHSASWSTPTFIYRQDGVQTHCQSNRPVFNSAYFTQSF